ncbi:MAG TPA: YetF domain-containing protein [Actinomycetota bacterium]|jgi:uncharacterized membrane protein YcaP (DUF421 family)|nr:YetF domain-containing protein [Actinomycetota bacterium]
MEIIVRATALFFFVWFLMRLLGKRELSEMTAFELVLLISIGDLIQQGITQEDMSVTGAILAVGTIGVWIAAFSFVAFRWKASRNVIEGTPVLVVRSGVILDEVLHLERVTRDEVMEAARDQGIEDIGVVRYGVLEANGRFSFISGGRHQQPPGIAE